MVSAPVLSTIGYEGASIADVLAALRTAGIAVVIDVRAVAASRKPGFSKRMLAAGLAEQGIAYLHLQGLGTPKAGRQAVRAGRPAEMRAIYAKHLTSDQARAELAHAVAAASSAHACLLCFERDHRTCHRDIVAGLIAEQTGQTVSHLLP
jgi:uncharacterized protein (DUF488 family)